MALNKFWKRYLNLPLHSNNATVHFLTNTMPLITTLHHLSLQRLGAICLPKCMEGVQLSFFKELDTRDEEQDFMWKSVPSYFWRSRTITRLPADQKYRRKLCREVFDTNHYEFCRTSSFHTNTSSNCICKYCNEHLHAYHGIYDFCNALNSV